jgi:hypothetical protein
VADPYEPILSIRIGDAFPAPPLHNLLLDHGDGCPPACQYRQWVEQHRPPAETSGLSGGTT